MKCFNTTGLCNPDKHYMVDITENLIEIKKMIDAGKYFTINRARQYGKTTTLNELAKYLGGKYLVISLDFQDIDNDVFETGGSFSQALARLFLDAHEFSQAPIPEEFLEAFEQFNVKETKNAKMDELFRILRRWCLKSNKPIVLMIDEVDSASNNQVFLDFLAQLRSLYLKRESDSKNKTLQSVILAGVTDVKHIRSKIRDEDQHKMNSPWNIAADYLIDMSFSPDGIRGMLNEYEADHQTGMDTGAIAQLIYDYTCGYPYLVSRLCQIMDENLVPGIFDDLSMAWSPRGMDEAVKVILADGNSSLFQSLTGKLENSPEMKDSIRKLLMEGEMIPYNVDNDAVLQLQMYGFVKRRNSIVTIANRIFETRLYNYFLSEEDIKNNAFTREGSLAKNIFVTDGKLNMHLILERFIQTYTPIFGSLEEKFPEKDGRELFLLYLRPIINGTGNYYIEAQTRDQTRTDVVIDYLGKQYVIELKIWRGARYNEEGEKQLEEYLDYFRLDTGYMLSFNFNKKKETGVKRVDVGGKVLFEGVL